MEQSSYEAQLHHDIKLVCSFSKVKSLSDLHVIWHRIHPEPEEEVYRYGRGRKMQNFTNPEFRERAQLIHEQLNQSRAVLHLRKLRISDSGIYRCIVRLGDDGDYKDIRLSVTGETARFLMSSAWCGLLSNLDRGVFLCFQRFITPSRNKWGKQIQKMKWSSHVSLRDTRCHRFSGATDRT